MLRQYWHDPNWYLRFAPSGDTPGRFAFVCRCTGPCAWRKPGDIPMIVPASPLCWRPCCSWLPAARSSPLSGNAAERSPVGLQEPPPISSIFDRMNQPRRHPPQADFGSSTRSSAGRLGLLFGPDLHASSRGPGGSPSHGLEDRRHRTNNCMRFPPPPRPRLATHAGHRRRGLHLRDAGGRPDMPQ